MDKWMTVNTASHGKVILWVSWNPSYNNVPFPNSWKGFVFAFIAYKLTLTFISLTASESRVCLLSLLDNWMIGRRAFEMTWSCPFRTWGLASVLPQDLAVLVLWERRSLEMFPLCGQLLSTSVFSIPTKVELSTPVSILLNEVQLKVVYLPFISWITLNASFPLRNCSGQLGRAAEDCC